MLPKPAAPSPKPAVTPPEATEEPPTEKKKKKRKKALWEGFFMNLNLGYATAGGEDGPEIPDAKSTSKQIVLHSVPDYRAGVTTNKGSGPAAALQLGYNIKGYVSLAADFSWHGSFGPKLDTAGAATAAVMLGLHPLRFWRDDLPVDVKLYGGYGFFDILYYAETQFQEDATYKSWTGTAIPFGLSTEYRFDDEGVFSMGADLRAVRVSYDSWMFNWDRDEVSHPDPPVSTFRFEPRLMFGWHF